MPPSADPARRAVVTGLGAVMPIGNDFETYWRNLRDGVSGVARITAFDPTDFEVKIAAEVKGFRAADHMDAKMARRMSRFIHFAMAAAKEALASAGLDPATLDQDARDRFGVVVNTGGGGIEQIVEGTHVRRERGPRFVSPFAIPALSGSMAACMLSMEYGLTGPVMTQVAACATSVIAFHDALRLIATGECDVVLTGGSEAPILEVGIAALGNMGALSKRNDDPTHASRPFDRDRDGFVLGEGAGVVVVESLAHALARGATPIAEVLGGALTADAFHISAPEPTGRGASRAMTLAREHAGVTADEIDWIVAHGTSTPLNDSTESRAIKASFGPAAYGRAISSPKSMIGHLVGAAGIASALAALGGLRDQVMSPTANLENPDLPDCDLDYVPGTARPAKLETVMVNGFGFGGQNAVAIFRKYQGRSRGRAAARRPDPTTRPDDPTTRRPGGPAGRGPRRSSAPSTIVGDACPSPSQVAPARPRGGAVRRPALAAHRHRVPLGSGRGGGVATLPVGLTGSIVLALPVLAVGVFAVAYPVGLAATRLDAILGAVTGAIVAADLLALITVAAGERVAILGGANVLPVGFLAAILATPAAVGGIAASQLFSPHGFGRRAGRIGAVAAIIVATPILLVGVPLLA